MQMHAVLLCSRHPECGNW